LTLDRLDTLRARLAVRGWVRPRDLLDVDLPKPERSSILAELSRDVETQAASKPGQWYMKSEARQRIVRKLSDKVLKDFVSPLSDGDKQDPIRRAFDILLNEKAPKLPGLDPSVLSALSLAQRWASQPNITSISPRAIETALARSRLEGDLKGMTSFDLVGQKHHETLDRMFEFATSPADHTDAPGGWLRAAYVYGTGGSGKTTVLAFLRQRLRAEGFHAVAHLDFDEPALDPTILTSLNLALFEQLTATLPSLEQSVPDLLDHLHASLDIQRTSALGDASGGRVRNTSVSQDRYLKSETLMSQAASSDSSLVFDLLNPNSIKGPLTIILDTAELIMSQGDRVSSGITEWLSFLQIEAGASDIRLIISGRDPIEVELADGLARRNLLERLAEMGVPLAWSAELPELSPPEAETLLRDCGVAEDLVQPAANAVPGNPLLLRITADALKDDNAELRDAVQRAHRQSKVDVESAQKYLMRRVVAHVADPESRPYVLGAMYLPVLTRDLLEDAVIPTVDHQDEKAGRKVNRRLSNKQKADRLFRALASAKWLTRMSLDGDGLRLDRNLRDFALGLLRVTDPGLDYERQMRMAAAIHHLRHRGALHRAMALYQLSFLKLPFTWPREKEAVRPHLRDLVNELPDEVIDWLDQLPAKGTAKLDAPESHASRMSDFEWQLYLEGDENREGEGMALVRSDRANEALALYMERPTQSDGFAPSFVLRALADLGDWRNEIVDADAIIDEFASEGALSPSGLSMAYWLTRLELQKKNGLLTHPHYELFEAWCRNAKGPALDLLPPLASVAEPGFNAPLMDDRMRQIAMKPGNDARILLSKFNSAHEAEISVSQIMVVQRDWHYRITTFNEIVGQPVEWRTWQQRIDELEQLPLAEVTQKLSSYKDRVSFNIGLFDTFPRAVLFRGHTPEFYNPLREAMFRFHKRQPRDGERLIEGAIAEVSRYLSIVPQELESDEFWRRFDASPRTWISAFILFADQARVLPELVRKVGQIEDPLCQRVATSFMAWDQALSSRYPTDWVAEWGAPD